MKKSFHSLIVVLCFFGIASGCSPEHQNSASFSSGSLYEPNPNPDPVLRANAKAAFENHCIECHGTGGTNTKIFDSPGGSINMDNLAQNRRYISIGEPEGSYLVRSIYTLPMPAITPSNNFFTDPVEQKAVDDWVKDLGILTGEDNRIYFDEIEADILAPKCYGCHESGAPSFSDYDSVLSTIVIPGNPDSALLRVVKSGEMPRNQPDLAPEEIDRIESWIMNGALESAN